MVKNMYVYLLLLCCTSMYGMKSGDNYGMKSSDNDDTVVVRMGGYALQRIGKPADYAYLYDVVSSSNDTTEIRCSGIFDNNKERELCESMQTNFFPLFKQAYAEKKLIKESLLYACASCRHLMSVSCVSPIKGFNLLISCVECEAKKLHLLWLGDVRGIVQGEGDAVYTKTYKPVEVTSNYALIKEVDKKIGLRDCCRKVEWTESPHYACVSLKKNDEYFFGASSEFWDIFKETEVVKILSDASELNEEEFNEKYTTYVHDDIDESPFSYNALEDGNIATIARKMVYVTACNKERSGNPAVIITALGFSSSEDDDKSRNNIDGEVFCYLMDAESSSSFSDCDLTQSGEIQVDIGGNRSSSDEVLAQGVESGKGWLELVAEQPSMMSMVYTLFTAGRLSWPQS